MTAPATASSLAEALTAEALDASGAQYFTVHTHANQHVGYFPGAKPVHILMHVGADGLVSRASRGRRRRGPAHRFHRYHHAGRPELD